MKKHLVNKTLWLSFLSGITSVVFILLAYGSIIMNSARHYDGTTGLYTDEEGGLSFNLIKRTTGKVDGYGRWEGKITIEYHNFDADYTEETFMSHGVRQGLSTRTYADGHKVESYYFNDKKVDLLTKSAQKVTTEVSAFQLLDGEYPWFLFAFNAGGFGNEYVESFMDTLETMLNTYEFAETEFDTYYEDVLNGLSETPFDSIIALNSNLFLSRGLQELKNTELRMAVIDHYRSEGISLYDIVNNTYPGYLLSLNDSGVVNADFEKFCQDLEDSLTVYGPLDLEDPFFTDSVDARLFRFLSSIISGEGSSFSLAMPGIKSAAMVNKIDGLRAIYRNFNSIIKPELLKSSSYEVAAVVTADMLADFLRADILRQVVREAYFLKKAVIVVPTVATAFSENISASSVRLKGYVFGDGGAAVISSGIAWGTFYNPTINENTESSEPGLGEFTVTVTGLTEGSTYYARSYATNSAGTAYGNCISFIASVPTGLNDNLIFSDLAIYPNPSPGLTTIAFLLESSANMEITVLDVKGQLVYEKNLGILNSGENQVKLDLSVLQNGIYTLRLTNGTIQTIRKLVIAR